LAVEIIALPDSFADQVPKFKAISFNSAFLEQTKHNKNIFIHHALSKFQAACFA
jgi:hypothetical protein